MTLLAHDHIDHTHQVPYLFWAFEHVLKIDNSWVVESLEDGHLGAQLGLVLIGETKFVNHLHSHLLTRLSVLAWRGEGREGGRGEREREGEREGEREREKVRERGRERERKRGREGGGEREREGGRERERK